MLIMIDQSGVNIGKKSTFLNPERFEEPGVSRPDQSEPPLPQLASWERVLGLNSSNNVYVYY